MHLKYNRVKNNLMRILFLVHFVNLHMFRAYLDPSSGGTSICIQELVLILLFRWLSNVLVGLFQFNQDKRRWGWRNILRISRASSCRFCTEWYRDTRSTKHKKYTIFLCSRGNLTFHAETNSFNHVLWFHVRLPYGKWNIKHIKLVFLVLSILTFWRRNYFFNFSTSYI